MNIFDAPWKVILIVTIGIFFPLLKIPILMIVIRYYPFREVIFTRIPRNLIPLFRSLHDNYFWWQFGCLFGLAFFTKKTLDLEWFTFFSIFYDVVIYQSLTLTQWPGMPVSAVVITSTLQFLDNRPLLFTLIDNIASVYHSQSALVFLPQKLGFYLFCLVYDMVRL